MIEWKKFEDERPEEDYRYLYCAASLDKEKPYIGVGWYHPKEKEWSLVPEAWISSITHWAYVNLPKEEGREYTPEVENEISM